MERKQTNVTARNGKWLHTGDIVQSVQDTVFVVVEKNGSFFLSRPEGVYDLEFYMSPNIWVIGSIFKNPEMAPWIKL